MWTNSGGRILHLSPFVSIARGAAACAIHRRSVAHQQGGGWSADRNTVNYLFITDEHY